MTCDVSLSFYENNPTVKIDKYRRLFDNVNNEDLFEDFNNIDWNYLVYTKPCIDPAVNNLSEIIENLLENHAPLIKIPDRKLKYCSKPWIDTELQAEIH